MQERNLCLKCWWPREHCWCGHLTPVKTRTKIVLLMHPKEFKQTKAGTGRFSHIALADSEIHIGVNFEDHEAVQALIRDPSYFPMLLYPGAGALNLTEGALKLDDLQGRRLLVFLLDATWACAKKMLKLSPSLQALPRIMFIPQSRSRWVIKHQPHELCLSTLEAVHELMSVLEKSGLDEYPLPHQLLDVFAAMQKFQLDCAEDSARQGYRRRPYRPPAERTESRQGSRNARNLFFRDAEPSGTGPVLPV